MNAMGQMGHLWNTSQWEVWMWDLMELTPPNTTAQLGHLQGGGEREAGDGRRGGFSQPPTAAHAEAQTSSKEPTAAAGAARPSLPAGSTWQEPPSSCPICCPETCPRRAPARPGTPPQHPRPQQKPGRRQSPTCSPPSGRSAGRPPSGGSRSWRGGNSPRTRGRRGGGGFCASSGGR